MLYVAHLPSMDMLSADAVAEMEVNFDDIARELHDQASEQLRGPRGALGVRAAPGPDHGPADRRRY